MKKFLFVIFFILFLALGIIMIPYSKADNTSCDIGNVQTVCKDGYSSECQDLINQCSASINQALQDSIKATAPLQSKLDSINSQIQGIKDTVSGIEVNLAQKKEDIDKGYQELAKQQTILMQQ
jgi:peptidoglycan hydrolase CwlO-like protein